MAETIVIPTAAPTAVSAAFQAAAEQAESLVDRGQAKVGIEAVPQVDQGAFNDALDAARRQDAGDAPSKAAGANGQRTASREPKQEVAPRDPASLSWKPKKASEWDSLKTAHATEIERYKTEIETLKKNGTSAAAGAAPPPPPDLSAFVPKTDFEKAQREAEEYRNLIRDVAIERDPEFTKQFESRRSTAIKEATVAAGEQGDKLTKLLALPDSEWRDEQISALIEELPAGAKRRVDASINLLTQLEIGKAAEVAARKDSWEGKQREAHTIQQRNLEAQQKEINAAFESIHGAWSDDKEGMPFYQARPGEEEHNAAVKLTAEMAKKIYSGNMSAQELAEAAHWAAAGPRILEAWQTDRAELDKLRSRSDSARRRSPDAGMPAGRESKPDPNLKVGNARYDEDFRQGLQAAKNSDLQR